MHTWKLFAAAQGLYTALSQVHPRSAHEEEEGHCADAVPIRGPHHRLESVQAPPSTL